MVTCTWLVENGQSELLSTHIVHGLSCFIHSEEGALLFDCGPDATLLYNAPLMEIDLCTVRTVVLSHSHYDHAGGFPFLVGKAPVQRLYTGPHFFEPKYAKNGEVLTYLGCGFDTAFLRKKDILVEEVPLRVEIAKGLWVVGGFQSSHPYEQIPSRFVKQTGKGIVPDRFEDEVCLVVDHKDSLSMLVGCSHVGVASMVARVEQLFGSPVTKLYGGFHLGSSDDKTIASTLSELASCQVQTLGMCHCSGSHAVDMACNGHQFAISVVHTGDTVVL